MNIKDLKNLEILNLYYLHYNLGEEYYGDRDGNVYKKSDTVYKKMNPYKNRDGYIEFVLTNKDKKKKHIMAHIICATLFVQGRTPDRNEVNHKDGNRSNNVFTNLEWMSRRENIVHSYEVVRPNRELGLVKFIN